MLEFNILSINLEGTSDERDIASLHLPCTSTREILTEISSNLLLVELLGFIRNKINVCDGPGFRDNDIFVQLLPLLLLWYDMILIYKLISLLFSSLAARYSYVEETNFNFSMNFAV